MSENHTNVRSLLMGRGAVQGIAGTLDRFLVTSMPLPWDLVKDKIGAEPAAVLMADSMEVDVLERQLAEAPPAGVVLAIGGGRAIDLGKYIAWKRNCRLITVPTALTVDAFVTPAAGVRRNQRVEYVGTTSPDPLVIDFDLLRTAPAALNIAGVGDLLSIHTATRDWEIAHLAGRDQHGYDPEAIRKAREILQTIHSMRNEIRLQSDEGLKAIVEGYMGVNSICLPAGHYRAEEGSEHFLFYELEERLGRPFIHGEIVGLGVYLMSLLQGNSPEWACRFMDELGLNYQPGHLGIRREDLTDSLLNLRAYVETQSHWFSVVNTCEITRSWIDEALDGLRF